MPQQTQSTTRRERGCQPRRQCTANGMFPFLFHEESDEWSGKEAVNFDKSARAERAPSSDLASAESTPESGAPKLGASPRQVQVGVRLSLNKNHRYEELWSFEEDVYSLAICALAQRGMSSSIIELLAGIASPTLQIICFSSLYIYLCQRAEVSEQGENVVLVVVLLCLFLMLIQMVREVHEGSRKIVFSYRCFAGRYVLPGDDKMMFIGIFFGTFQIFMAMGTFALTTLLLMSTADLLEVFMNYVALGFITDIDQYLMEIELVKLRKDLILFSFRVEHAGYTPMIEQNGLQNNSSPRSQLTEVEPAKRICPMTMPVLIMCNATTIPYVLVNMGMVMFVSHSRQPPLEINWLLDNIIATAFLLALNAVVWFGSRQFSAFNTVFSMAMVGDVIFLAQALYCLWKGAPASFTNPSFSMVWWCFSMWWTSYASAAEFDCLHSLNCPLRLPSLFGFMVAIMGVWMLMLTRFGEA